MKICQRKFKAFRPKQTCDKISQCIVPCLYATFFNWKYKQRWVNDINY